MPESEIHILSAIQNMEARPEDAAYGLRTQEAEIKKRINTLFSNKEEQEEAVEEEEDYETVNEGMTTDTTEAPQYAQKRGQVETVAGEDKEAKKEEAAQEVEEGILSSDEEEAAAATTQEKTKQSKVGDKPLSDRGEHDIRSFAENAAKGVFETDKAREEVENRFNFGEQDVEYFGAKLQSRQDRDTGSTGDLGRRDQDEEADYVSKTQYDQAQLDKIDMHSLNLFGVPLDESIGNDQLKDIAGSSKETQRVLRDLIEITEEASGEAINNFSVRKSFVYYDPYEPDQAVTYAYLKYEDETKLRASVVLDFYKKEIESISDESLSFADKERKQQVLHLIDYLGSLKIIDSQVLLKLYELYRLKL